MTGGDRRWTSTLIPFALRESDQRFVGVGDVAAGLACGCICPSRKSRLIARKGAIKVWHFARATERAWGRISCTPGKERVITTVEKPFGIGMIGAQPYGFLTAWEEAHFRPACVGASG